MNVFAHILWKSKLYELSVIGSQDGIVLTNCMWKEFKPCKCLDIDFTGLKSKPVTSHLCLLVINLC